MVKYVYDPWGQVLSAAGSPASAPGTVQFLRYGEQIEIHPDWRTFHMHSKKYLLRMLINSYVFALVVFGIILVLGTFAYVSIGHYNMVKAGMDTLSNYLRIALFFCLLLLGLFIAFMMESYDMFGQVFIF